MFVGLAIVVTLHYTCVSLPYYHQRGCLSNPRDRCDLGDQEFLRPIGCRSIPCRNVWNRSRCYAAEARIDAIYKWVVSILIPRKTWYLQRVGLTASARLATPASCHCSITGQTILLGVHRITTLARSDSIACVINQRTVINISCIA